MVKPPHERVTPVVVDATVEAEVQVSVSKILAAHPCTSISLVKIKGPKKGPGGEGASHIAL